MEYATIEHFKADTHISRSANLSKPTFHPSVTGASSSKSLHPTHFFSSPVIMPSNVPLCSQHLYSDNHPWFRVPHSNSLPAHSQVHHDFISKKYFHMESYSSAFSSMSVPNDYVYQSSPVPSHELCISQRYKLNSFNPNIVTPSQTFSKCYDRCNGHSFQRNLSPFEYNQLRSSNIYEKSEVYDSVPRKTVHYTANTNHTPTIVENKYRIQSEVPKSKKNCHKLNIKPYSTNITDLKCPVNTRPSVTSPTSSSEGSSEAMCLKISVPQQSTEFQNSQQINDFSLTDKLEAYRTSKTPPAAAKGHSLHCKSSISTAEDTECSQTSKPITLTFQSQFPVYFMKGSIIQLANGKLKKVEALTTEDFTESALQNSKVSIDHSIIVHMHVVSPTSANVTFCVGKQKLQVTVEAAVEHPFFVFQEGWSSCSPERTMLRYGLPCRKLAIGDACISLSRKERTTPLPDQVSELVEKITPLQSEI